jgi:RNA polymerase sigma factor (sigma-70 family)
MSDGADWYARVIRPMEAQMIRCVWRVLRHPDDADDALQSALLIAWRRRRRVARHPNPRALVLRICLDAAHDVLRKRLRRHRGVARDACGEPADVRADPAEDLARAHAAQALREVVAALPRRQATAFLMHAVEGEPYREIAAALRCAEATARAHVARARKTLRRRLGHLAPAAQREVQS